MGASLLLLNLGGLRRPVRPDALAPELTLFRSNLTLSPADARRLAVRGTDESDSAYVARLTWIVHRAMGHYWPADAHAPVSARVPVTENFLLWGAAVARPDVFARYEFFDPDRALDRGFGLCSQFALVMHRLLRDAGIRARYVSLKGHVVVEAETLAGGPRIADADFGIVLPFGLAEIERSPELVRPFYEAAVDADARTPDAVDVSEIVTAYAPDGNVAVASPDDAAGGKRGLVHAAERTSYALKWLLPLTLLAIALVPASPAPVGPARRRAPDRDVPRRDTVQAP